ncbi:MAG: hypothetical protein OIF51_08905 [Cellvibrionaceae bacterium]|nr:hypothetical protein [Cellvibrionaceae bacterium]
MYIDWLKASEDERKQLYVATRAVADAADISVEEIMDAALGRKVLMGTDYMSTFRRGKIRRSYSKLIFQWISANHLSIASNIAPQLFRLSDFDLLNKMVSERANRDRIGIARFERSMGLVARKRDKPIAEETLCLGEDFCFHLDSKAAGFAVALQGVRNEWHLMPLGNNETPYFQVVCGSQFLPLDERARPERLVENEDRGLHQFVLAVVDHPENIPTHATDIDRLSSAHLYSVSVQFN